MGDRKMTEKNPSSDASRHLLPQGEKEKLLHHLSYPLPSPLAGEGGTQSVSDEGAKRPTSTRLKSFAKTMRKNPTEAERTLWSILRNNRFSNYKFRHQVPIERYIADFVCYEAKLIVELDGSQHAENEKDIIRDNWLKSQGFQVLRVWNNDLSNNKDSVLDAIWNALQSGAEQ